MQFYINDTFYNDEMTIQYIRHSIFFILQEL